MYVDHTDEKQIFMKSKNRFITKTSLIPVSDVNTKEICKPVTESKLICNIRQNILQIYVKDNTTILINSEEKIISGLFEIKDQKHQTTVTMIDSYRRTCLLGIRQYTTINLSAEASMVEHNKVKSVFDRFDQEILHTMEYISSIGQNVITNSESYIHQKWKLVVDSVAQWLVKFVIIIAIIIIIFINIKIKKKIKNKHHIELLNGLDGIEMSKRLNRIESILVSSDQD